MKGSSYSLRVMKNAKQYTNKHSAIAQSNFLEVPSEAGAETAVSNRVNVKLLDQV